MSARIYQLPPPSPLSHRSVRDDGNPPTPPSKKPKLTISRAKRRWLLVQRHLHLLAACPPSPSPTKAASILVDAALAAAAPATSWPSILAPLQTHLMASFRTPHVRLHVVDQTNSTTVLTFDGRRLRKARSAPSSDSALWHAFVTRTPIHLPTKSSIKGSAVVPTHDVLSAVDMHTYLCLPFVAVLDSYQDHGCSRGQGVAALIVDVVNAGCGGLASAAWCAAAEDLHTKHELAGVCHVLPRVMACGPLTFVPRPLRPPSMDLSRLVNVLQTLVGRVAQCRVYAVDTPAHTLYCRFPPLRDAFAIEPTSKEPVQLAVSSRQLVHVEAAKDASLHRTHDDDWWSGGSAELCVPLMAFDGSDAIGVLKLVKSDRSPFMPIEVAVGESLAVHFAAVLAEISSTEARTAVATQSRVLDEASALPLDLVASSSAIEAYVARCLQADACHLIWQHDLMATTSDVPLPALTAVQTKQRVNIHDVALAGGTRGAALAVPILGAHNTVLGVLCATHKSFSSVKPYFDTNDDQLAACLARQLAANRIAFEADHRHSLLLSLLQRLSPTASKRQLSDILADVEVSLAKIVGADVVTIFLVEPATSTLFSPRHAHNDGGSVRDGLAASVASAAAPLHLPTARIPCVHQHRAFHPTIDKGTTGVVSVPIFAPQSPSQPLGVLHAVTTGRLPSRTFQLDDVQTLQVVATSLTALVEGLAVEQLFFPNRKRPHPESNRVDDSETDESTASVPYHHAVRQLINKCTTSWQDDGVVPPPSPVAPPATPPLSPLSPSGPSVADELKQWTFDPFRAGSNDVLVGHSLHIFQEFSLHQHFQIGRPTLRRFVSAVRDQYRDVPYHNFLHAFTTLHVTFLIVLAQSPTPATAPTGAPGPSDLLERRDILALFIGAMCHDMNHNGRTNDFHIKTRTATAMLYNDQSVLENMHAAHCFDTLRRPGHNVLENASCSDYMFIRKAIIRVILATDMGVHASMIQQMTGRFHRDVFNPDKDKELLLNAIVHSADIANPALATPLHARWSNALMQEFNAQYEEEIALGVAPNAYMSAKVDSPEQARMNMGFIDLFCFPLWRLMAGFLHGLDGCIDNLHANRAYWAVKADEGGTAPNT